MADLQTDLQRSLFLLRTLLLLRGEVESPGVVRQTVEEVIAILRRNVTHGVSGTQHQTFPHQPPIPPKD